MGHLLVGGPMYDQLRRFKVGKSPADINRALQSIVRVAYRCVPVYHRLMKARAVDPKDVRTPRDLARMPIVSKQDLFRPESIDEVLHCRTRQSRCVRVTTSGSSGIPFSIYMSKLEAHYRRLLLLLAWKSVARLSFPFTVVELVAGTNNEDGLEIRHWGPITVLHVYAGLPAPQQLRILKGVRPQLLTGPPTALEIFADALESSSTTLSPRHVVTRGEILYPNARRKIEAVMQCRVSDFYNSEEIGNIAWECPQNPHKLHLNTDACIVEIVNEDGSPAPQGSEGRVLVTSLYNRSMPFLRYELGDRAALLSAEPTPCSCGSRKPCLSTVSGRTDDFLHLPDGRRLSPRVVAISLVKALSSDSLLRNPSDHSCLGFQVVQDAVDHVIVRIIPEQGSELDFESIIGPEMTKLHPALRSSVVLVDELESLPSGKLKKVISRIPAGEVAEA